MVVVVSKSGKDWRLGLRLQLRLLGLRLLGLQNGRVDDGRRVAEAQAVASPSAGNDEGRGGGRVGVEGRRVERGERVLGRRVGQREGGVGRGGKSSVECKLQGCDP